MLGDNLHNFEVIPREKQLSVTPSYRPRRSGMLFEGNQIEINSILPGRHRSLGSTFSRHNQNLQPVKEQDDYTEQIQSTPATVDSIFVQRILSKDPKRRKPAELSFLQECFKDLSAFAEKNVKSNSSGDSTDEMALYRNLRWKKFTQLQPVFLQGDPARECFIVLEGEALILKKYEFEKDSERPTSLDIETEESEFAKLSAQFAVTQSELIKIKTAFPSYYLVGIIKPGKIFGELGLYFQEDRSAAVIARTTTLHLGCLSVKHFHESLQAQVGRQIFSIVEQLKTIHLFKDIESNLLSLVALSSESLSRNINSILFKQTDPIDKIYFLISGEVRLYTNSAQTAAGLTTPSSRNNYSDSLNSNDSYQLQQFNELSSAAATAQNNEGGYSTKVTPISQILPKYQHIVGSGGIFGDEESASSAADINLTRKYTCQVISSSVQLIRVKSVIFFTVILKSFKKMMPELDLISSICKKNSQMKQHCQATIRRAKPTLNDISSAMKSSSAPHLRRALSVHGASTQPSTQLTPFSPFQMKTNSCSSTRSNSSVNKNTIISSYQNNIVNEQLSDNQKQTMINSAELHRSSSRSRGRQVKPVQLTEFTSQDLKQYSETKLKCHSTHNRQASVSPSDSVPNSYRVFDILYPGVFQRNTKHVIVKKQAELNYHSHKSIKIPPSRLLRNGVSHESPTIITTTTNRNRVVVTPQKKKEQNYQISEPIVGQVSVATARSSPSSEISSQKQPEIQAKSGMIRQGQLQQIESDSKSLSSLQEGQLCVTYRHLNLHRIFPNSKQSEKINDIFENIQKNLSKRIQPPQSKKQSIQQLIYQQKLLPKQHEETSRNNSVKQQNLLSNRTTIQIKTNLNAIKQDINSYPQQSLQQQPQQEQQQINNNPDSALFELDNFNFIRSNKNRS